MLNDEFFSQEIENDYDYDTFTDVYSVFSEIRNQIIANLTRTRMTSALYNNF